MSDGTERCPDCDEDHADWEDKGTAIPSQDAWGVLDLWECTRCGYTLEGTAL